MTSVVGIFDKKKTETKEQEEKNKEGWEEYKADLLKHLSEEMEKEGVGVFVISYKLPEDDGSEVPELGINGMFPVTPVKAAALVYFLKRFLDSKLG